MSRNSRSRSTIPTPQGSPIVCALPSAGIPFAPRIRHFGETRLFSVEKSSRYPTLEGLIGGTIHTKQITAHWDEVSRLASSIQEGTVTASLMLRKLGAYPREIGKLERTIFLLEYIQNIELRKRIQAGLNKGRLVMRWLRPCSLTGRGNCATAPTKTSDIGPAA